MKNGNYNILALDVATKCGWAISKNLYGVWDLTPKRDESSGMRLIRFRSKLSEMLVMEKINLIVFERVSGIHKGALIVAGELHGILKAFCIDHGIEHKGYSATEIKKYATGKGNAGKPLMVKAAKEKYSYPGNNDNEADALHILHLAKEDLGL